jgi:DNA-binding PadR family transcriptional regulator
VTGPLTNLEYTVLGLVATGAADSGYAVRKLIQDTPLIVYSDSPGSVYPAITRLERLGLLRGAATRDGRKRRALDLTAAGRRALVSWLDTPIGFADVARGDGAPELKLSFMSDVLPERLRGFLDELTAASRAQTAAVAAVERSMREKLGPSGRIALGLGLSVLQCRIRFLERVRAKAPRAGAGLGRAR